MLTPEMYYQIKSQFHNPTNQVRLTFDPSDDVDFPVKAVTNFITDPFHMEIGEDGLPNFHHYKMMIPGGVKAQRAAHRMLRIAAWDNEFAKAYLAYYGDHFLCVECSFKTPKEHETEINIHLITVLGFVQNNRPIMESIADTKYCAGPDAGLLKVAVKALLRSADTFKYSRDIKRLMDFSNYKDVLIEDVIITAASFALTRLLGVHFILANVVAVYLFNRYYSKKDTDFKNISIDLAAHHIVELAVKYMVKTGHPVAYVIRATVSTTVGGLLSKTARVAMEDDEK